MTLNKKMQAFIEARRGRMTEEDALDAFLEEFLPNDEDQAIAAFKSCWVALRVPAVHQHRAHSDPNSQAQADADMLTAPYRFIPLNDRIALPEDRIRKAWEAGTLHSLPLEDGFSGRLEVNITFDGAMLLGQPETGNTSGPMKLGEDYVIPGSSLRGLVRASLETAAFARLTQTNLHRRFGIRDFEHELFSDENRKAVRAGWLRKAKPDEGGKVEYLIEPCKWYRVAIRGLGGSFDSPEKHRDWLRKGLLDHYRAFDMVKGNTITFDKTCSFALATVEDDGAMAELTPAGRPGVLVFSDKVPSISGNGLSRDAQERLKSARAQRNHELVEELEVAALEAQSKKPAKGNAKRTEVIFAHEGGAPLSVPAPVWETFLDSNTRASAHKRKAIGNWKILSPSLENGGRIPVFWVSNDAGEVVDFGLVRVFKRAHAATVRDVLGRTGQGVHLANPDDPHYCPDFVEALFGYVHEPEDTVQPGAALHQNRHLKSRVSVGFAHLAKGCAVKKTVAIETVQAAPKPSFAPFYLAAGGRKDWSAPGAELAGRKVYPPRNADAAAVRARLREFKQVAGNRRDDNRTGSSLILLEPASTSDKLVFTGDILLHNVTAAELGGLIWALTLGGDPDLRHMIGRARTAGAGQARIEVDTIAIADLHGQGITEDAARAAFVAHMQEQVPNWQQSAPITALLHCANPKRWETAQLGYLKLSKHRDLRKQAYAGRPPKRYLGA